MKQVSGDTPERPLDPPDNIEPFVCRECGEEQEADYWNCWEHLESTEDLREYAHEKVECLNRLIGENRSLNAKIDGGVETVKEQNSQIEKIKRCYKDLQKAYKEVRAREIADLNMIEALKGANNELITLNNQFLADSLGITKGQS